MAVKSEEGLFLLLTNSILEFKDFVDITNYVISIYDRILFKFARPISARKIPFGRIDLSIFS